MQWDNGMASACLSGEYLVSDARRLLEAEKFITPKKMSPNISVAQFQPHRAKSSAQLADAYCHAVTEPGYGSTVI
jgi:hypothetical protein